MLLWDKPDVIEGLVTYRDETRPHLFYVMPNQPRYRIDDNGLPVFRFLKYRNPIDRPGGRKGGGFLAFDVEFTVPDAQMAQVKARLQERLDGQFSGTGSPAPQVQIGVLSYTRGAASLQFLDSGGALVERIQNPGAPSLFGKMITPFTVELSPEGATLAEAALQDKGGLVQVVYDLFTPVKMPPVTATVWFHAEKFMEFHQHVDIDWSFWGEDDYRETIQEKFLSSESGGVEIDPGAVTDPKVIGAVRDWAWTALEDAVKRMVLGDIAPVAAEDRKVPDGIDNLWRDVSVQKVASFRRTYKEGQVMEWNPAPRGTLPNITTLTGSDGQPYKWQDFFKEVDLDDEFFRSLDVTVRANADFEALPIHSVEVHLEYQQGGTHRVGELSFQKADDVGKFQSFVENGVWKYRRWYEVNYKSAAQTYKSPVVETDERILTINVDDAGVLQVDVLAGDLNFNQVAQAQVTLSYEDQANGVEPVEQVFTLDKTHTSHRFQKLIFQPRRNPYTYRVKYFMADGKELETAPQQGRARQLSINDPFSATRTVGIRAAGNLETEIGTIFVDLRYTDAANGYTQTHSIALSKATPFFDWSFPVISETGGQIVYSGVVQFKDGTSEPIPETTTANNTIRVGKEIADFLEVQIVPDIVDWAQAKLVKVSLHYADQANGIDESKDFIFKNGTPGATWKQEIKDKTRKQYRWQATFFLNNGAGSRQTQPVVTADPTIILEVPAA